jgi:hypothetical protein
MAASQKDARIWAADYFRDNPGSSIDDCCRAADAAGLPLHKSTAAQVRRVVLEALVTAHNHANDLAIRPKFLQVEVELPEQPKQDRSREARIAFVNELLDKDPGLHPDQLKFHLREKFDKTLDAAYLYEVCRLAREVHGLPQIPTRVDEDGRASPGPVPMPVGVPVPAPDPVEAAVRILVQKLKEMSLDFSEFNLRVNEEWVAEYSFTRKYSGKGKVTL